MMLKIGITGGIGSGKSLVCKVFEKLNVAVYHSDEEAKKLLSNDPEIISKIKRQFGEVIYQDNNALDKNMLAKLIFNDKEALNSINKIVHPAVKKDFNLWLGRNKSAKYIIKEAAIMFESNSYLEMDKIICISCPINIRINRVVKRDRYTREEVMSRIKNQMEENEIINRSDYIINNDGNTLLLPQIIKLHKQFNK